MKKGKNNIEHKKWEVRYELEDSTTIWKYDSKKSMVNPYEVEVVYKNEKSPRSRKKSDDI
jgi:hypothetical protein